MKKIVQRLRGRGLPTSSPVWCGQLDRCSDDDLMMMMLLFPDSRHSSFVANTHGHKLKCLGVKLDPRPKVMLVDTGLQ